MDLDGANITGQNPGARSSPIEKRRWIATRQFHFESITKTAPGTARVTIDEDSGRHQSRGAGGHLTRARKGDFKAVRDN
jgi:hypothetical protein